MNNYQTNWQKHWEKHKLYYFLFSGFLLFLVIFLIANASKNQEIRKVNERLGRIEKFFSPLDEENWYSDYNKKNSGGGFVFPDPKKQKENWIEETIHQEKVRQKIENWIKVWKYLPHYQDSEAPPEISRHLLLYGPPGTGKSFIAEELAKNEALAYSFVSFETVIFTGSSKEVQDRTLRNAIKILQLEELKVEKGNSKPVVIIIDELDSVGTKDRSGINKSSNVEVNNIQKMVDEIYRQKLNIIIIGITNYPDLLEPALIRSGRLGQQVKIDYPTNKEVDKLSDYLEKITKKGYRGGDKNVVWPADFWTNVRQINQDINQKSRKKETGFSLRDCQEAIANSLAYKVNKNLSALSPASDDYRRELKKIIKNKIRDQKPENLQQPNLTPQLIKFLEHLAKFNGTGN